MTLEIFIRRQDGSSVKVRPPNNGTGWNSVDEFIENLVQWNDLYEPIFSENMAGSDPNLIVDTGYAPLPFNYILSTLHYLASDARKQTELSLSRYIIQKFRLGIELIGPDNEGVQTIFRYRNNTAYVNHAPRFNNSRNSRNMLRREEHMSFEKDVGTVLAVKKVLSFNATNNLEAAQLEYKLRIDEISSCINVNIRRKNKSAFRFEFEDGLIDIISGQDFVNLFSTMSCVYIAFFLKFDNTPLSDFILSLVGVPSRIAFLIGKSKPLSISHCTNTYLDKMLEIVCNSRNIRKKLSVLTTPVLDVELFKICKYFEIGALVIDTTVYDSLLHKLEGGMFCAGVISTHDYNKILAIPESFKMNAMMSFCPEYIRHKNYTNCNTIVFRVSNIGHQACHLDVVLSAKLEHIIAARCYAHSVYDVSYACATDNPDGYFKVVHKQCVYSIKANDFKPIEVVRQLSDLYKDNDFFKKKKPVIFLKTEADVVNVVGSLYECVHKVWSLLKDYSLLVNNRTLTKKQKKDGVLLILEKLPDFFGADIIVCSKFVSEYVFAEESGLIAIMGFIYSKVKNSSICAMVDFSDFVIRSSGSYNRRRYIQSFKKRNNNNFINVDSEDVPIYSFHDISNFTPRMVFANLIDQDEDTPLVISKICSFSVQDLTDYELVKEAYKDKNFLYEMLENKALSISTIKSKISSFNINIKDNTEALMKSVNTTNLYNITLQSSMHLMLLLNNKAATKFLCETMATFGTPEECMLSILGPSIHEPPIPLTSRMGLFGEMYEVDMNRFYYNILLGNWDFILQPDIYGNKWCVQAMKRPNVHLITYKDQDVLTHYSVDYGYSFIDDFNSSYGTTTDMECLLESWKLLDKQNSNYNGGRYILNSAVIHFCGLVYSAYTKKYDTNPDPITFYGQIQSGLLNIKYVKMNYSLSERTILKRYLNNSTILRPYFLQDHISGIFGANVIDNTSKPFDSFVSVFKEVTDKIDINLGNSTLSEKDKRSFCKRDVNKMIGMLKYGHGNNNIVSKRVSDIHEEDDTLEYKICGHTLSADQQMNLFARNLPNNISRGGEKDLLIVQQNISRAVDVHGSASDLRIHIIDKGRHIIDLLAMHGKSTFRNTDAVFVTIDGVERINDFMTEYGKDFDDFMKVKYMEDAEDARDIFRKIVQDDGPLQNRLPFRQMRTGVPTINDAFISDESKLLLEQVYDIKETNVSLTSHALGHCSEFIDHLTLSGDCTKGILTYGDDTNDVTLNILDMHFLLYDLSKNYHSYDYPILYKGKNLFYEDYCLLYSNRLQLLMKDMGHSFLIEGPPGSGKSYAMNNYIRTLSENSDVFIFITTSTHSTLKQYSSLEDENVKVSTLHSFVGTFNGLAKISSNPGDWFNSREAKYKSLFVRNKKNYEGKRILLIIDEYEMLSVDFENILFYLKKQHCIDFILIGDPHQTASFGASIRCEGTIVRNITNNRKLFFDVPFRRPEKHVYEAQALANKGYPSLLIKFPLCDSRKLSSFEDTLFSGLVQDVAREYVNCARERTFYSSIGISTQNYKLVGYFTVNVLMWLRDIEFAPANVEYVVKVGTLLPGESEEHYMDNNTHVTFDDVPRNPPGKNFLCSTKMPLFENGTYKTLNVIKPFVILEGENQCNIPADSLLMYIKKRKVHTVGPKKIQLDVFEFEDELNKSVYLLKEEIMRSVYFPFITYRGNTVGSTYKDFYVLNAYKEGSIGPHYVSSDVLLQEAEDTLGDVAWQSPIVKHYNVAVSRSCNMTTLYDIQVSGSTFWHEYYDFYFKETFKTDNHRYFSMKNNRRLVLGAHSVDVMIR